MLMFMLAVLYKHFINCYTIERFVTSYFNDCVMVYDLIDHLQ